MKDCPWSFLQPGDWLSCEESTCSWIMQPFNTYSNIGFIIVSLLCYLTSRRHKSKYYLVFSIMSFLMGAISIFAHASKTYMAGMLDYIVLFLLINIFIALNLRQLWIKQSLKKVFLWIISIQTLMSILLFTGKRAGMVLFAIQIVAFLVSLIKWNGEVFEKPELRKAQVFFLFAVLFIALDILKFYCIANFHWFQFHGLWHLLNAVALYYLIQAFNPEKETYNR